MSQDTGIKLSVAGKGGVGKTTIAAGLALTLAGRGQQVLAVDGDSNNCLGYALGFPAEQLPAILPLAQMREELEQRAQPAGTGMFLLAPPVADLIDKYSLVRDTLGLLVMGTIGEAGGGCACGLNAALRQVLRELVKRPEGVVVDMEAGVEHLGRGTAAALDTMLLVTEPAQASLRTCRRAAGLATDLGVKHLAVIGNKIRSDEDLETVRQGVGDIQILGAIPYLEDPPDTLTDSSPSVDRLMATLSDALDQLLAAH